MNYRILLAALATAFFSLTSCNSKSDQPLPTGPREVKFSFGGEFANVTYEPLSRADNPAKYYAMNISRKSVSDYSTNYTPYAYGVFDNIEDMKILLSPDYTYKFECTSLIEDKHRVAKINDADGGKFMYPFCVGASEKGYLLSDLNKFVTSTTENLTGIANGKTTIAVGEIDDNGFASSSADKIAYASQMRYYGARSDFQLGASPIVELNLKSVSFGIKVVASNIPDGSVTVSESGNNLEPITVDTEHSEDLTKYVFEDAIQCIAEGFTGPTFVLKFTWNRENGGTKTATKVIDIRRNTLSVITLNLDNGDKEMSFSIVEEGDLVTSEESNVNAEVTIK